MNTSYAYKKAVKLSFQDAVVKTKEALKEEGFGIISEINMKEAFKQKIDKDIDEYIILGACNPGLAFKALQIEQEIGLFLPCNVIVFSKDKTVYVSAIKPSVVMGVLDTSELSCLMQEVEPKLQAAIDRV